MRRSSAPPATSTLPVMTPLLTGRGPLQKETHVQMKMTDVCVCVWLGQTDGGPAGINEGSSSPSGQIHQQSGGFQCLFLTSLFNLCALFSHKSLLFTSVCCVNLVVSPDYGRRHREMSVSSSERRSPTGTDEINTDLHRPYCSPSVPPFSGHDVITENTYFQLHLKGSCMLHWKGSYFRTLYRPNCVPVSF